MEKRPVDSCFACGRAVGSVRGKVCEPVGVGVTVALVKGKGKTLGGGLVFRGKGPAAGGRGRTAWVLCFFNKRGAAAWKMEKRGAALGTSLQVAAAFSFVAKGGWLRSDGGEKWGLPWLREMLCV